MPADARGVVLFAHGSGSSRHSPRNRAVADALRRRGFATLLFDLLTPEEDRDRARRFDIALLARRLSAARDRVRGEAGLAGRPVGLFGARLCAIRPYSPTVPKAVQVFVAWLREALKDGFRLER